MNRSSCWSVIGPILQAPLSGEGGRLLLHFGAADWEAMDTEIIGKASRSLYQAVP